MHILHGYVRLSLLFVLDERFRFPGSVSVSRVDAPIKHRGIIKSTLGGSCANDQTSLQSKQVGIDLLEGSVDDVDFGFFHSRVKLRRLVMRILEHERSAQTPVQ